MAAACTLDNVSRAIGAPVGTIEPAGCASYFIAAGYDT